jgi:hypothetical protein
MRSLQLCIQTLGLDQSRNQDWRLLKTRKFDSDPRSYNSVHCFQWTLFFAELLWYRIGGDQLILQRSAFLRWTLAVKFLRTRYVGPRSSNLNQTFRYPRWSFRQFPKREHFPEIALSRTRCQTRDQASKAGPALVSDSRHPCSLGFGFGPDTNDTDFPNHRTARYQ